MTIALTGGIGSGKSTVACLFKQLGTEIIDTDVIARQIVEPDKPAFNKIIQQFGKSVICDDGKLDRKKLSDFIFNDLSKKHELEEILHPLIFSEIYSIVQALDCLYCIVVIPLLIETGKSNEFDRILVIDVSTETQISRTVARDNITADMVNIIINNQA
ncbi:MAG: dephospho-CoA kinase, partial [Pseudomonadota bacterium]